MNIREHYSRSTFTQPPFNVHALIFKHHTTYKHASIRLCIAPNNIDYVIEFLLGEGVFVYRRDELKKNGFGHITSIKQVIELKLTDNPTYDPNKSTSNMETTAKAPGMPAYLFAIYVGGY